jgi:hypothetical protein
MKFDIVLRRISKRLSILGGIVLAAYLGIQGLIQFVFLMSPILRNNSLAFEEEFLLMLLLYLVLLFVFASFVIKNKVLLKTALVQIDELFFFSQPILMLLVAFGLLGMVMFMTFILLW